MYSTNLVKVLCSKIILKFLYLFFQLKHNYYEDFKNIKLQKEVRSFIWDMQ